MNAETLEALNKSIAHWERFATGTSGPHEKTRSEDCALCESFIAINCKGCPVAKRSGSLYCRNTPWQNAQRAFTASGKYSEEFKAAAKVELDFLKSLLPEAPK